MNKSYATAVLQSRYLKFSVNVVASKEQRGTSAVILTPKRNYTKAIPQEKLPSFQSSLA